MNRAERHTTMQRAVKHAILGCLASLVGAAYAGDAAAGDIRVTDAWSRATPPGVEVGAAYFVINNRGQDDRLVGVSSPVAERAALHRTTMEGGLTKMQHNEAVDVNGGEPTVFAPGGRHVMLMGLKRPLRGGDTFALTLNFEKGGSVQVPVEVRGIAGMPHHTH